MTEQEIEKRAEDIYDCERQPYLLGGWETLTGTGKEYYREKAKQPGRCLHDGGWHQERCPLCGALNATGRATHG